MTHFPFFSVTMPYKKAGLSIGSFSSYVKIETSLGLVAMWNQEDSFWVCLFLFFMHKYQKKLLNSKSADNYTTAMPLFLVIKYNVAQLLKQTFQYNWNKTWLLDNWE